MQHVLIQPFEAYSTTALTAFTLLFKYHQHLSSSELYFPQGKLYPLNTNSHSPFPPAPGPHILLSLSVNLISVDKCNQITFVFL